MNSESLIQQKVLPLKLLSGLALIYLTICSIPASSQIEPVRVPRPIEVQRPIEIPRAIEVQRPIEVRPIEIQRPVEIQPSVETPRAAPDSSTDPSVNSTPATVASGGDKCTDGTEPCEESEHHSHPHHEDCSEPSEQPNDGSSAAEEDCDHRDSQHGDSTAATSGDSGHSTNVQAEPQSSNQQSDSNKDFSWLWWFVVASLFIPWRKILRKK